MVDLQLVAIMGVVTFINFAVLVYKYNKGRYKDLAIDVTTLGVTSYLFGGTITGLLVAMMGSLMMSLYLLWVYRNDLEDSELDQMGSNAASGYASKYASKKSSLSSTNW